MPNISRSKENPTMRFRQFIEYNMRNIFLKKPYAKWCEETSPRRISKNLQVIIPLEQLSGILCSLFLLYVQVDEYQNILELRCWPLAFTSYKTFLKPRKKSKTSPPTSFSAWFLKENMFHVVFYSLTKFHCLVVLTSWDIG